jgi:hypothetical protein
MNDKNNQEHGVLKRDIKRVSSSGYRPLNVQEFSARTVTDIVQEFRRLPNPPAKDTHAAK